MGRIASPQRATTPLQLLLFVLLHPLPTDRHFDRSCSRVCVSSAAEKSASPPTLFPSHRWSLCFCSSSPHTIPSTGNMSGNRSHYPNQPYPWPLFASKNMQREEFQ